MTRSQVLTSQRANRAEFGEGGLHGRAVEGSVLDEKIPRAVFDGRDGIFHIAMAGQHDHIDIRLVFLHPLQDRATVETGHAEVGDDAVERSAAESIEALLSAPHALHFAAFIVERLLHDEADEFFVVDEQGVHAVGDHRAVVSSFATSEGLDAPASTRSGKAIKNLLPVPGVDSAQARLLCLSMTSFTIASPTPVPS